MSTTTIRIPDELKARLSRIAEQEGISTHGLILDAISEKADALEQRQAFHAEARMRLARMEATGMGIAWDDMKCFLDARMAGEDAPLPASKRIGT
jgi:predicted transcriptional regulator